MADIRLTGRPRLPDQPDPVRVDVAAQQHNYLGAMPAGNSDLQGLVSGLSALVPALAEHSNTMLAKDMERGRKEGLAAAQKADLTGRSPSDMPVAPVAPDAPPAYSKKFGEAFSEATAHRLGIEVKAEAAAEYERLKGTEDFDVQRFLAEKRQKLLGAVQDPIMADVVGRHFAELESGIHSDQNKIIAGKRAEARFNAITALAHDAFGPELQNTEDWSRRYEWLVTQGRALQMDPKDVAAIALERAKVISAEQNGMPEVFDYLLAYKDKTTGLNIAQMNPQLAQHITAERAKAKQQSDQKTMEVTEGNRGGTLIQYQSDLATNPSAITIERILADGGKFGALPTAEAQASMWHAALVAQQKRAAEGALMAHFDAGTLWALKPEDQRKVLDARLGGVIQGLVGAVTANKPEEIQRAAQILMQAQSRSGSTVQIDQLARFIETHASTLPTAAGPSPGFIATAELYKAMSADPEFRSRYFKDDVKQLMDTFTRSRGAGSDDATAHKDAYRAISPEAKSAADTRMRDPKVVKDLHERAVKNVEGSSWWPRWLGGNGRPENQSAIGASAGIEAKSFLTRFPDASDEQVQEHVRDWAARNYVMDETTNLAVKVPPGLSGKGTQQALTNYSKALTEKLRTEGRMTEDASLRYIPTGTEGQLQVEAWDGTARRVMGVVNVQSLVDMERTRKVLSPEEQAQLGAIRGALKSGGELPQASPELLGKLHSIGVLDPREEIALKKRYTDQYAARVAQVPRMSFGPATSENLTHNPNRAVKVDHQLTAEVALQFAAQPVFGPKQEHVGLAASLITMGEAVVLRASDDPAQGAGKNIGMGYNLRANVATVHADLKRAGVPADRIQDVIEGKAELLPEQAKRLLSVSLPRYEKQVMAVAEATAPGLWDRMTPPQKAVMLDVAWQVGDPAQFKKAWAALAAGDAEAFAAETKTTYVNKQGQRVDDTRRSNLRANMLAGIANWNAIVSRTGGVPTTKLQVAAQ
jgi:hypothetical protein